MGLKRRIISDEDKVMNTKLQRWENPVQVARVKWADFEEYIDPVSWQFVMDTYRCSAISKNGLRKNNWRVTSPIIRERQDTATLLARDFINRILDEFGLWNQPEMVEINVTQFYCNKPYDYEGLACVVAPTIDGLFHGGLFADDNPEIVQSLTMQSYKVPKVKQERISVRVSPFTQELRISSTLRPLGNLHQKYG